MKATLCDIFLLACDNVELSEQFNRPSIDGSQSRTVWRKQIAAEEEEFATCHAALLGKRVCCIVTRHVAHILLLREESKNCSLLFFLHFSDLHFLYLLFYLLLFLCRSLSFIVQASRASLIFLKKKTRLKAGFF